MKSKFMLLAIFVVVIGHISLAEARVQRMAIPRGSYNLTPHQKSSVPAFCLDHDRAAPAVGDVFSNVLSSSSDVIVHMDGKSIPLQDAIESKLVAIEGKNVDASMFEPLPSPNEYLNMLKSQLSQDPSTEVKEALQELQSQPIELQLQFASELLKEERAQRELILKLYANEGDFRHLSFKNLTDKNISIEVKSNAIVGGANDDTKGLQTDLVSRSDLTAADAYDAVQEHLWLSPQQSKLKELGFSIQRSDGVMDESTQRAIADFESRMGIDQTSDWRELTKLIEETVETKHKYSRRSPPAIVIKSVAHPPPTFLILKSDGTIGGASRTSELAERSFTDSAKEKSIEYVFDGLTENDAIALCTTVRVRSIAKRSEAQIKFDGVTDARSLRQTKVYKEGNNWVGEVVLDTSVNVRRTLKIVSSVKERVLELLEMVASLFSRKPDLLSMPIDKMIIEMRKELPHDSGIGVYDEELHQFHMVGIPVPSSFVSV